LIISKTPFCKILTQNVLIIYLNNFFKLPLGTNRLILIFDEGVSKTKEKVESKEKVRYNRSVFKT